MKGVYDLTAVTITLEMKPQLHDIIVKLTAKSFLVGILPLAIDDLESDVFVRRSSAEAQNSEIPVVSARCNRILRCRIFVDQIRIEDVEFVALNDFRRRIIHVVMRLVVLVPFEPSVDAIEVARFARSVFIRPKVNWFIDGRFN